MTYNRCAHKIQNNPLVMQLDLLIFFCDLLSLNYSVHIPETSAINRPKENWFSLAGHGRCIMPPAEFFADRQAILSLAFVQQIFGTEQYQNDIFYIFKVAGSPVHKTQWVVRPLKTNRTIFDPSRYCIPLLAYISRYFIHISVLHTYL